MNINFFASNCQSKTNEIQFGLCDDLSQSHNYAYIDINIANKEEKWIAIIENNNKIEITFTAIDNCIEIRRSNGEMDNRCDGMLTYQNNIIFVELKERSYKNNVWIEEGEKQLKSTLRAFTNNYNIANFKSKKAYVANRKKPNFQYAHKERMQKFRNETGFILLIENTIKI